MFAMFESLESQGFREVGDEGLEPLTPVFPDSCYFAVFPVFPTVPAWFAIHSNSLQITAITGKVWAKCGHGWARVAHQIIGRLRHFYKRV